MKKLTLSFVGFVALIGSFTAHATCPYGVNCLSNPYGAGNPYKSDGLLNPYSQYGSKFSNKSWTNPYATNAPKVYDQNGNYRGRFSTNKFDPDSISNPYGRYGNKFSNGNIFGNNQLIVVPQ